MDYNYKTTIYTPLQKKRNTWLRGPVSPEYEVNDPMASKSC